MPPAQRVRSVVSNRSCGARRVLAIEQMFYWNLQFSWLSLQIRHPSKVQGPDFNTDCLSPVWWWAWVQDSAHCLGTGGCGCGPNYRQDFGSGSNYGDPAGSVVDCCGTTLTGDDRSSWWPSGTDGSKVPPPQSLWPSARGLRLLLTHSTSTQGLAALPLCLLSAPSQPWHPLEGRRTYYWLAF